MSRFLKGMTSTIIWGTETGGMRNGHSHALRWDDAALVSLFVYFRGHFENIFKEVRVFLCRTPLIPRLQEHLTAVLEVELFLLCVSIFSHTMHSSNYFTHA